MVNGNILSQIEREKQKRGFLDPAIIAVQAREKKSVLQIIAERQQQQNQRGSVKTNSGIEQARNVSVADQNAGLFSRGFFAQAFIPTVQPPVRNPIIDEDITSSKQGSSGQIRSDEQQEIITEQPQNIFDTINVATTAFRKSLNDFLGGLFG